MKVLVIGLSPYLLTSRSKVSALVMRYLYVQGFKVAGAAWAHDTSFFIPDENNELFYEFDIADNGTHKIPLKTFNRGSSEAVEVYEIMNSLQPDLVITVGDYGDFAYMKAVKMFYNKPFKWLLLLMNYSAPINENNHELIEPADGVLCTSKFGYNTVKKIYGKELIDISYLGCNLRTFSSNNNPLTDDKFRIMTSGKCHQVDNLPTVIEAVYQARQSNPDIELYVHANLHDRGDYDLELVKNRFDPKNEFIRFPDKFVSLHESVSDQDLASEMQLADLYISLPLVSATSMAVFDAISCGCYPLMSNCGSNYDVANILSEESVEHAAEDFLVPCVKLMSAASSYLHVCDSHKVAQKINTVYNMYKKKAGCRLSLGEFTNKYNREGFLVQLSQMIDRVQEADHVVCLETIGEE